MKRRIAKKILLIYPLTLIVHPSAEFITLLFLKKNKKYINKNIGIINLTVDYYTTDFDYFDFFYKNIKTRNQKTLKKFNKYLYKRITFLLKINSQ